ncbi:MAG TPA: CAP domain-containing protein [Candidatus Acidoferrales bacterium]|nr:CAP domain-containing protein [Candidatus Acidoferrales bacterium]
MKLLTHCAFVFLLVFAHAYPGDIPQSPAEKRIFEELNQERISHGLLALEWNEQAATTARAHARLLAENGKLSHQFLGEAALAERLGTTGARFTVAAENVALTGFIEDVHPALMRSSGHRANMLNTAYNAVGIGVVQDKGKIYVTQDFIYFVPDYSESQFNAAFAEEFNLVRKSKGIRQLDARPDAQLHELACSTDGNAAKLADKLTGVSTVVVFTASDPHHLPEELNPRAANADFHIMKFGACFRPDKEHGYANFWVVAAFAK